MLVQSGSLSGDPVYLVVTYEYVPDFSSVSSLSVGATSINGSATTSSSACRISIRRPGRGTGSARRQRHLPLQGGHVHQIEYAYSEGVGTPMLTSVTGGLSFNPGDHERQPCERRARGDGRRSVRGDGLDERTDQRLLPGPRRQLLGPRSTHAGMAVHQDGASVSVPVDCRDARSPPSSTSAAAGAQSVTSGELGSSTNSTPIGAWPSARVSTTRERHSGCEPDVVGERPANGRRGDRRLSTESGDRCAGGGLGVERVEDNGQGIGAGSLSAPGAAASAAGALGAGAAPAVR